MNTHHAEILKQIKANSGVGTQHTSLDSYLGNSHPRYPITAPVLRKMSKEWMRTNKQLPKHELEALICSLVEGESSTEKVFAGMLLDCASKDQGSFPPKVFDQWLDHLEGWAEVDSVCTGEFTIKQIPDNWKNWKPLLSKLSKSKNISKRRASIVLLCSPLSHCDDKLIAEWALENIDSLKHEKDVMITKAISWLLRSMIRHHKTLIKEYVRENAESLPKIAVRETLVKLKTGTKTKRKKAD